MRLLHIVIQLAVAITLFLGAIFSAMFAMELLPVFAVPSTSGLWLILLGIFFLAFAYDFFGTFMIKQNTVVAQGCLWGSKAVVYWLALSMIFSMLLRLDFSPSGVAHAVFFFCWPGEPLLLKLPSFYAVACSFALFVILWLVTSFLCPASSKVQRLPSDHK